MPSTIADDTDTLDAITTVEDGRLSSGDEHPPPMRLSWDILAEVMAHLPHEDASRLSRTCQTLFRLAPRYLLYKVSLWHPTQFLSFYAYMFNGKHDGSHFLKVLKIAADVEDGWDAYIPDLDERLATLFAHASGLKAFDIDWSGYMEEGAFASFASMTSLRTLKIEMATPQTAELFQSMKAPLTCIYIRLLNTGIHWSLPPDLAPPLAPFRKSLRVLEAKYASFDSDAIQFPHLITLRAQIYEPPVLQNIIRCFPNLEELYIYQYRGWSEEEIQDRRRFNQRTQARTYCWPSLRFLRGDLTTLYTLAVRCHVHEVYLIHLIELDNAVDGERLSAVLADTRPPKLSINLRVRDLSLLAGHLSSAQDALRELSLWITCAGAQLEESTPVQCVIPLLESLSEFSIHTLEILMTVRRRSYGTLGDVSIDVLNNAAIAQHAARCIRTLRLVAIVIWEGETGDVYEVHHEANGPSVRRVMSLDEYDALDTGSHPTILDWEDGLPAYWDP